MGWCLPAVGSYDQNWVEEEEVQRVQQKYQHIGLANYQFQGEIQGQSPRNGGENKWVSPSDSCQGPGTKNRFEHLAVQPAKMSYC